MPNHNERDRRFRAIVWRIIAAIVVVWAAFLTWGVLEIIDLLRAL